MAQYTSQATVPGILKELYDDQKVQNICYTDNPWLAMIKKEETFEGKYYPNSVMYGLSSGSATFSNAYNNQSSASIAEFLITRVSDYALATLDGQLMKAAQTNIGAFMDAAELLIDAAFQTATNRLATAMFRNGAGTIGQILSVSNVSGTNYLVTLNNPDDAVNFNEGDVLVAVQNVDGSGSAPTDTGQITAINRNLGQFNVTSSTNVASDWPTLYYLAVQGDLPNATNNNYQPSGSSGTNSLLKLAGLAAWLPIAGPPVSDSFFGVNRNLDVQRLSGTTFDGSALSLQEALIQGTSRIAIQGGKVDTGICSFATFAALITSLGSNVVYIDHKVGEIGFQGIKVYGANSVMTVFPDRSCPDGVIYCLTKDSWVLRSADAAPSILTYLDGIELLRVQGQDATELRVGTYGNMYCTRPAHNGVVKVQVQEF